MIQVRRALVSLESTPYYIVFVVAYGGRFCVEMIPIRSRISIVEASGFWIELSSSPMCSQLKSHRSL